MFTEEDLNSIKGNFDSLMSGLANNNPLLIKDISEFDRTTLNKGKNKEYDQYEIYERALYKTGKYIISKISPKQNIFEQLLLEMDANLKRIEKEYNVCSWNFNMDLEVYENRYEVYDRAVYRMWGRLYSLYYHKSRNKDGLNIEKQ